MIPLGGATLFLALILFIILHLMVMIREKRFIFGTFQVLLRKQNQLDPLEQLIRKVSVVVFFLGIFLSLIGLLFKTILT
jgi:hypothetical protein